jgi:hypothetical protein
VRRLVRAQARKAVKIAYALRFANLADFVAGGTTRVFADAARISNLYDDPIT